MVTRKIKWLSALNKDNVDYLIDLQIKLKEYYTLNTNYYLDISFTENVWLDKNALIQQDLIIECLNKKNILEIGCGQAFILKTGRLKPSTYTGVDFSATIISKNRADYNESNFLILENPNELPFRDQSFDLVFSHFVIEHTVFPNVFLDECTRVLMPGGTLILVAPDFLRNLNITSQKSGFSNGTGREKLKAGRYLDALVTAFDNKIRIPSKALFYLLAAYMKPRFFININPTCFYYEFSPDLDAVYLTYEHELIAYLKNEFKFVEHNPVLRQFIKRNRLIYLKAVKSNKQDEVI